MYNFRVQLYKSLCNRKLIGCRAEELIFISKTNHNKIYSSFIKSC